MLFVLVLLAGAVTSEAGVIHHPSANYGLRYPVANSRGVGPAVRKSYGTYPEAINQNIPRRLISHPGLSVLLNPTMSYRGPIGHYDFARTHVTPPRILPLLNPPISHELQSPAITTAYASTPVWLNPALNYRPLGPAPISTHLSSPVVLNPTHNSHVAVGASYVKPLVLFSPALNEPAIGPSFKRPYNIPLLPNSESVRYGAVVATKSSQSVLQTPINSISAEVPDKTVSYSLSGEDYEYLKRHKTEGKDSPYNPAYHTASPVQPDINTHAQHGSDSATHYQDDNVLKQRSGIATVEDLKATKISSAEDNLLKESSEYDIYHTETEYSRPSFDAIQPIVTKHISFHVPPPDFEEPPPTPVILPPRKKNYNILFIKTPSQEPQNYAYLQELLSRQSQAEEKTLIYVLAKTPNLQQQEVLLPPVQKVSSPEVYFIKYATKLGATSETTDGLDLDLLDNTPVLEHKRSVMESCPEETLKEKI